MATNLVKDTIKVIEQIKERGYITEREVLLLRNRVQKGMDEANISYSHTDFLISEKQKLKGLKWLRNLYKTPKGKECKNNPFGYREQRIIDANDCEIKCYLTGFYNIGKLGNFYVPMYRYEYDGCHFDYYVACGECIIIS